MTDTTVSITSEGGEQFFKHFYNYMDTSRQNLKHLYHEESKVSPAHTREKRVLHPTARLRCSTLFSPSHSSSFSSVCSACPAVLVRLVFQL